MRAYPKQLQRVATYAVDHQQVTADVKFSRIFVFSAKVMVSWFDRQFLFIEEGRDI